jgi:hypothetical protein
MTSGNTRIEKNRHLPVFFLSLLKQEDFSQPAVNINAAINIALLKLLSPLLR